MFNKYNRNRYINTNNRYTRKINTNTVDMELISDIGNNPDELLIIDKNGILVSFPKTLIKANDLKLIDGQLTLSASLYDTWFKPKIDLEIAAASEKLYSNFSKLVKSIDLILNDKEYYRVRLPFLKSTVLYNDSIAYPLGKLLQSWVYEDVLEVQPETFMMKINISLKTGVNNYTAYSMKKKSLVTGSLRAIDIHWEKYLNEFYSFANIERNESELLVLTRLLKQLEID